MEYNYQQYRRKESELKELQENQKLTTDAQDINHNNEPIYVMTVELEEGSSQSIKIYSDSTPEELAFEFCKKNNLDINAMKYLTDQIKNLLEELNENMGHVESAENQIENDCIQEVDEEEIVSDTRKTSKTIPSHHLNPVPQSNIEVVTLNAEKNRKPPTLNTPQAGLLLDSLNASLNIQPSRMEEEDNQIIDTKELMEDNEMMEQTHPHEDSKVPEQKLFQYQVVHKSSKKNPLEEISRSSKLSSKTPSKSDNKIFERLYRNTEHKKYGAYKDLSYCDRPKFSNTHDLCKYIQRGRSCETLKSKPKPSYRDGEVINFGERLYQKGLKLKEEQMKKAEYFKREMRVNQANIYTYKPQINQVDPEIIKKRIESLPYNKEEYILRYNEFLQDKLERLRKKHGADIEYSFTPIINSNSEKIANEKLMNRILSKSNSLSPDPHLQRINDLYETARMRQMRMNIRTKQHHDQYNYRPAINDYSKFNENGLLNLNFDQRQEVFRKRSEDKIKQLKDISVQSVDKTTGQNFFQPYLISKSKEREEENFNNVSRHHTSNIFNSLYSYAQRYSKNKKERENSLNSTMIRSSQAVHTGNDSEFLFYKKKEDLFKGIFKVLDGDQDDCISTLNIDTRRLPNKIKSILDPIFFELREENETLNQTEFVRACEHLYEVKFELP